MKNFKFLSVCVALALVFSACNKDVADQVTNEDFTGVKVGVIWVDDFGYEEIYASQFAKFGGKPFNNGKVEVMAGVELERIEGSGNTPVVIRFSESVEPGILQIAVKFPASKNAVVWFDTEALADSEFLLFDKLAPLIEAWGQVVQVRYGDPGGFEPKIVPPPVQVAPKVTFYSLNCEPLFYNRNVKKCSWMLLFGLLDI